MCYPESDLCNGEMACAFYCRVKLLTELHWQLPRPLTPADEHLRSVKLPDAESAVEELQHSVQVPAVSVYDLWWKNWIIYG